ncbi:uncharacterized protein B0H64DRAFT_94625 [Chaetomium fimeti]|uniref:Uncharacterized protein n=1 Tax=Chaetomium fimeti TaxID=1854472 RepID=A0AAE0HMK9_9PEZI|nr:hypothetical protein B0H64DRAFT_94625 [Chaetomium fimeti]
MSQMPRLLFLSLPTRAGRGGQLSFRHCLKPYGSWFPPLAGGGGVSHKLPKEAPPQSRSPLHNQNLVSFQDSAPHPQGPTNLRSSHLSAPTPLSMQRESTKPPCRQAPSHSTSAHPLVLVCALLHRTLDQQLVTSATSGIARS